MYKRRPERWLGHVDFIVLDFLSMHLSFFLAYKIRQGAGLPYADPFYRNIGIMLSLLYLITALFTRNYRNIFRRGYGLEFLACVRYATYIMGLLLVYLFLTQNSAEYSRAVLLLMWGIQICLTYLFRVLRKKVVKKKLASGCGVRSLILLTTSRRAEQLVRSFQGHQHSRLRLTGVGILDADWKGRKIQGVPVAADADNILDWIRTSWVDEVFLDIPADAWGTLTYRQITDSCLEMGITVHRSLAEDVLQPHYQSVEHLAGYTVLSANDIRMEVIRQPVFKRILDICGGLAGCVIAGAAAVCVGPFIYLKSPGPIFFTQTRVGKNGKMFEIYKFRSMYLDAEERKSELMDQNEMNGFMFKLENDPRVIKGIGKFIRRTSIDELPQFWNVLKGDMSLVGTRPPTVDEWEQYQPRHRKRLAVKPGMTGMWQVSGRSDITDFEEVVNLDIKYIVNWSFYLDVKILLKTVLIVLRRSGAA